MMTSSLGINSHSSHIPHLPCTIILTPRLGLNEPPSITLHLGPVQLQIQFLTRHPCTLNPIRNLFERDFARKVRALMLRLDIDTKRAKATIIRRTELIWGNGLCPFDQCITDLLWRFDLRSERVDHADESHLPHAVGIRADSLVDLLVDSRLVSLRRQLNQEVPAFILNIDGRSS